MLSTKPSIVCINWFLFWANLLKDAKSFISLSSAWKLGSFALDIKPEDINESIDVFMKSLAVYSSLSIFLPASWLVNLFKPISPTCWTFSCTTSFVPSSAKSTKFLGVFFTTSSNDCIKPFLPVLVYCSIAFLTTFLAVNKLSTTFVCGFITPVVAYKAVSYTHLTLPTNREV